MSLLKRLSSALAYLAVIVAIAGGGYFYWQNHKAKVEARKAELAKLAAAPSAPSISVVKVAVYDFVETVMVSGSLVPREEITVSPEVEGLKVLDLHADVGDEVKKGDVLATLVTVGLDAQIAQNEAALTRAEASIAQAKANITQAQARATEANLALERAIPLNKTQYLSDSVLDQRRANARAAEAQLNAARDSLRAAEAEKKPSHRSARRTRLAQGQRQREGPSGWHYHPARRARGGDRHRRHDGSGRRSHVPYHREWRT